MRRDAATGIVLFDNDALAGWAARNGPPPWLAVPPPGPVPAARAGIARKTFTSGTAIDPQVTCPQAASLSGFLTCAATCLCPSHGICTLPTSDRHRPLAQTCSGMGVARSPGPVACPSMRTTGRVVIYGRSRKCLVRAGLLGITPRRRGCCTLMLHASGLDT